MDSILWDPPLDVILRIVNMWCLEDTSRLYIHPFIKDHRKPGSLIQPLGRSTLSLVLSRTGSSVWRLTKRVFSHSFTQTRKMKVSYIQQFLLIALNMTVWDGLVLAPRIWHGTNSGPCFPWNFHPRWRRCTKQISTQGRIMLCDDRCCGENKANWRRAALVERCWL